MTRDPLLEDLRQERRVGAAGTAARDCTGGDCRTGAGAAGTTARGATDDDWRIGAGAVGLFVAGRILAMTLCLRASAQRFGLAMLTRERNQTWMIATYRCARKHAWCKEETA